jgi:Zn-dependent protease
LALGAHRRRGGRRPLRYFCDLCPGRWICVDESIATDYPGHSTFAYWVAGIASAVTFFAGLLAHELSHAVVAKHQGVHVDRITLWMLGGVARLRGEPKSPWAEAKMAGVPAHPDSARMPESAELLMIPSG